MATLQGELFRERKEFPLPHALAANFIDAKPAECRRTARTFEERDWTADDVCALLPEIRGVTERNIDQVRAKVRQAFAVLRKRSLEKPEQHAISL